MSVTLDEVRRIAALARLGLTDDQVRSAARELSSILDHMQVLARADTAAGSGAADPRSGMALRADSGPPIPLVRLPETFAPEMRDGFFLVPRLASHEDAEPAP